MFAQLISDARAAEWEHVGPEDDDRLFYKMAWWKKVIVMAGGPTVNILIAFFMFWGVFATYGNRTASSTPARRSSTRCRECVIPYDEQPPRLHRRPTRSSPAAEAGLRAGDVIVSLQRHAGHRAGTSCAS